MQTVKQSNKIMLDRYEVQVQAMNMMSKAQDVSANNLANINTPGYKGDRFFLRLLTEEVNGKEISRIVPRQHVNLEQGELEMTGGQFDFALSGEGFFVVEEDNQSYLTRNGRFQLDNNGFLRDERGAHVMGEAGRIYIPEFFHAMQDGQMESRLEVNRDGSIVINGEVFDRLQVVRLDDPSQIERRGNTYFTPGNSRLLPKDASTEVIQGHIEKGNIQALTEMSHMMRNMQMFEAQQRALRANDDSLSQSTRTLGRF